MNWKFVLFYKFILKHRELSGTSYTVLFLRYDMMIAVNVITTQQQKALQPTTKQHTHDIELHDDAYAPTVSQLLQSKQN